jgi:hypothetical protein
MTFTCKVDVGQLKAIHPFPACQEAKIQGCSCPDQDETRLAQGLVTFDGYCPIHQLEKVPLS